MKGICILPKIKATTNKFTYLFFINPFNIYWINPLKIISSTSAISISIYKKLQIDIESKLILIPDFQFKINTSKYNGIYNIIPIIICFNILVLKDYSPKNFSLQSVNMIYEYIPSIPYY